MKWAAADEHNCKHPVYLPGANCSWRMLSFLVKLIFYGLGVWVITRPLAVAAGLEPLRGSLAISHGDSGAVIVRGES